MLDLPIGVNALLFNEHGELLLGKRKNALGAGMFSLFGGHLQKGETIEGCIVRELREELGLSVAEQDVEVINFGYAGIGTPMIEIGVLIKRYTGQMQIMEPHACEELRFFPLDALPPIFEATRINIELYQRSAFYDKTLNIY